MTALARAVELATLRYDNGAATTWTCSTPNAACSTRNCRWPLRAATDTARMVDLYRALGGDWTGDRPPQPSE